jgi:hypothetical protein
MTPRELKQQIVVNEGDEVGLVCIHLRRKDPHTARVEVDALSKGPECVGWDGLVFPRPRPHVHYVPKVLAAPRKDGLTQRLADVDNRRIECGCLIAAGVVLKKKTHAMLRQLMPAPFHFRKRHRWAEIDVQVKVNVHIDAS